MSRRRPVRVVVANGMSASGVPWRRTRSIIRNASKYADVLLLCEVFNGRVADALGPAWEVAQHGAVGTSRATTAVAVRRERGEIVTSRHKVGVAAWLAKLVRARGWTVTDLVLDGRRQRRFSAGHAHPKRAWARWMPYTATTPRGVVGADWNKRRRAVAARFGGRQVRQIGLLGVLVPRGIPSTPARALNVGGDHRAVQTRLWPNS